MTPIYDMFVAYGSICGVVIGGVTGCWKGLQESTHGIRANNHKTYTDHLYNVTYTTFGGLMGTVIGVVGGGVTGFLLTSCWPLTCVATMKYLYLT